MESRRAQRSPIAAPGGLAAMVAAAYVPRRPVVSRLPSSAIDLTRRYERRRERHPGPGQPHLAPAGDYPFRLPGPRAHSTLSRSRRRSQALQQVRARLLKTCEVVSLDTSTLAAATQYQIQHGLSPQDAIVYASVLSHLVRLAPAVGCFLNRNSKDFEDPDIIDELKRHKCTLIPRFDHGLEYVRSHLTKESGPA